MSIAKKYKVSGMDCTSCATMIELDLEDIGVSAKCDYANSTLEVDFDPEKTKEEKIKETVTKAGYKIITD